MNLCDIGFEHQFELMSLLIQFLPKNRISFCNPFCSIFLIEKTQNSTPQGTTQNCYSDF